MKQLKHTYTETSIYRSKSQLSKGCKSFSMLHGQLMYNSISLVISFTERQHIITSDNHIGLRHVLKAKAMASHYGKDSAIQKI